MAPSESLSVSVCRGGNVSFVARDENRTVVWLRGEHDIATVAALSETIARAVAFDDADFAIDLSGVEFMGAATVDVIIRTRELLASHSRSLVLRSPSRSARRVLDLCGVAYPLDPRPDNDAGEAGTAGALGTWVAVPATDRLDPSRSKPSEAPDSAGADPSSVAPRPRSVDAEHGVDSRAVDLAGRGGQ
ncbi:MAG: STAS domain-containing protein [Acidimicrobiales bacterium]